MNLVTKAWIPVVKLDGTTGMASLLKVFTQGREFSDLAVRPHERIALMRLLICIAQAALDGPKDIEAWDKAPEMLPEAAERYLSPEKWRNSFELFYDQTDDKKKHPFLQVTWTKRQEASDKSIPASKMDIALAAGNNSTLFDHFGLLGEDRYFSPARIALTMLAFQNYAQGGGISSSVWVEKPKNYADAPCKPASMLHSFIRMNTLFETVCANLLTKSTIKQHYNADAKDNENFYWGKPIWEMMPFCIHDDPSRKNATETYLGRLVPLSRLIQAEKNKEAITLASGFEYPRFPDFPSEFTSTVVMSADGEDRKLLGAGAKAIWRELPALIVSRTQGNVGGALTLSNISEDESFDIWIGAVLIHPRKSADILDVVESVFHVPANMRTGVGRATYNNEVHWTEQIARKISWAVETYREQSDGGWKSRVEMTKPQDRWTLKEKLHGTATRHYWTAVEKLGPLLMAYVATKGMPMGTDEEIDLAVQRTEETQKIWRDAVHRAARESYKLACGRETPRQIRAFALGWNKLVGKHNGQITDTKEPETMATEE